MIPNSKEGKSTQLCWVHSENIGENTKWSFVFIFETEADVRKMEQLYRADQDSYLLPKPSSTNGRTPATFSRTVTNHEGRYGPKIQIPHLRPYLGRDVVSMLIGRVKETDDLVQGGILQHKHVLRHLQEL